MTFDPVAFEKYLRTAAVALDAAVELLAEVELGEMLDPTYLLARLNIAQEIVELELPEFQRAAMATVADMLGEKVAE